jgi:hypothetical protein
MTHVRILFVSLCVVGSCCFPAAARAQNIQLRGEVVDAATGRVLPARLYIRDQAGEWFFARSAAPGGSAVAYRKQRGQSSEMHTTLSAHPFVAELPPGSYLLTAERGKEYFPASREVVAGKEGAAGKVTLKLRRWIDMARRGWYSGDTHVHRSAEELPNIMLAEDLNVAFPLSHWVTRAFEAPAGGGGQAGSDSPPQLIRVDPSHVIYPLNTEYEIFSVAGKRHELGAVFLLNHRSLFRVGAPPVGPIAEQAHREGALIELDKHAWPWSMALVPVMGVDLYELANNHHWRTEFLFRGWGARAAPYMNIERDARGWTEWGWTEYGFKNYYALLNCGFQLRPTAGTASGVHPVPLGFGRVYVHLEDGFSYEGWLRGLDRGRSFVTTGPMLFVKVNGEEAGHRFRESRELPAAYRVAGEAISETPLARIEVIVNGEILATQKPASRRTARGAHASELAVTVSVESSSWIAARAIETRKGGRVRFAHSAPFFVEVPGKPLRPRRQEVQFLIDRVREQISRSSKVLPAAALDEYRRALRAYEKIAGKAR